MSNYILLNTLEENEITNFLPTDKRLGDLAMFFQIFSDSTRLKIISVLSINELCVSDLSEILAINQTTISHQLKYLKTQQIVCCRREGKLIKYSLCNRFVNEIMTCAIESLKEIRF